MARLQPRQQGMHDAIVNFESAQRSRVSKQDVTEYYLGPQAIDIAVDASQAVLGDHASDEDVEAYRLGWMLGIIGLSK